jgi:hypothetical protein
MAPLSLQAQPCTHNLSTLVVRAIDEYDGVNEIVYVVFVFGDMLITVISVVHLNTTSSMATVQSL